MKLQEQAPVCWVRTTFSTVFDILDSRRIPVNATERAQRTGSVPYYGATGQVGFIDDFIFDEDLLLLGEDGAPFLDPLKPKAYVVRGKSWVNNHAHVLRPRGSMPLEFWKYQLDCADYHEVVSGTTRPKLPQGPMVNMPLVVPPLAEQQRIVDALDNYFSSLDAAASSLEKVQTRLKAYRASVLKAAVEGRLVPTEAELARQENRDYEPAQVLLTRILQERRCRWEAAELDRLATDGKVPKDDKWKAKYEEPEVLDSSKLPSLPEGWCWASLDQLCAEVTDGDHLPPPVCEHGVPFLVIGDVRSGRLDFSDCRRVPHEYYNQLGWKRRPEVGDLLYTVVGSFGIPVRVSESEPFCVQRHIAILKRPPPEVIDYLQYALASPFVFAQAIATATGTAQKTVGLRHLRRFAIAIAPAAEIVRLVEHLEQALSVTESSERQALVAVARTKRLRQSILKWAFEGKLVDQDPTDEPAEALLARIQAERASTAPTKKPRGRKAKTES